LSGRVAIVTGAAVRLGRAVALTLAERGVHVVVHYGRSAEAAAKTCQEIHEHGSEAIAVQADLLDPVGASQRIVQAALDEFGRADILINSAAIFEAGSLAETDDDLWDRHFAINLKSPAFLCREFMRRLGADQNGHIVNIADWRATRPGSGHLAYTLTKSGIVTLTKSLARELAPGVQVNAIAPGAILPPPGADDDTLSKLSRNIPLRRTGSVGEVTQALVFLLASDFITGEVIHVSGGEEL